MPSSLDDCPILTAVRVVCRECLSLRELSHINKHIHGFLQLGSIRKACNRGSLRLIRLVAAWDTKSHWGDVARNAALWGHLDILQWVSEFHADRCDWYNVLGYAAASGHLSVVKWLHTHRQDKCTTKAMDNAASYGHLGVVKWLHDNRTEGCSTKAMDRSALFGRLYMVKWLHDNRTEGCSTDAMDWAASQGHLDVVKWLHDNRTEGCTVYAMTCAAKNGHLEVVKWLHENTGEGCLACTIDYVTNLDVVKWLHENLHQERLCSTRAIDKSAEMGRLDLVMWLHDNRTEGYTIHAIEMAAQNGHLDVVKWLFLHEGDKRRYRCQDWRVCCYCKQGEYSFQNETFSAFAVKMARKNGQEHVIEWVESLAEPESTKTWS